MQAEVDALKRRRSTLEDDVLEAMTEREPLDEEVVAPGGAAGGLDDKAAGLRAAIAEAQAAIDAELASRSRPGPRLPPCIPPTWSRRTSGCGAGSTASGRPGWSTAAATAATSACPATELDRAKREPPDALMHCEQCGRILVR